MFVTNMQLCVWFIKASIFVNFDLRVLLEQLRSDRAVVGVFVVLLFVR